MLQCRRVRGSARKGTELLKGVKARTRGEGKTSRWSSGGEGEANVRVYGTAKRREEGGDTRDGGERIEGEEERRAKKKP